MKRRFAFKIEPRAAVYAITFLPTGAQYVGSTNHLKRRLARHLTDLKCGRHCNRFLQRAWRKYGAERFACSVLEWVSDPSTLSQREQHFLDTLRPRFNFARSATLPMLGKSHSAAARQKIAAASRLRGGPAPRPGEENHAAVLTWDTVREIRARYTRRYARGGVTQKVLAAEYGVDHSTISMIVRGKTWVDASAGK